MHHFSLFCKIIVEKFAQFKKKQYLCTRFLIEGTCAEKKSVKNRFYEMTSK